MVKILPASLWFLPLLCLRGKDQFFSQFRVSRLRMQLQIHKIRNLFAMFEIWSEWMWKMDSWWSTHRDRMWKGHAMWRSRSLKIDETSSIKLMQQVVRPWCCGLKSYCLQQRGLLTHSVAQALRISWETWGFEENCRELKNDRDRKGVTSSNKYNYCSSGVNP